MALNQEKLNSLKLDKASRYERKSSGIGKWIGITIVLAAITAIAFWFIQEQKEVLPIVEIHIVDTPRVNSVPLSDAILNASGYVVARRQATVSSKVTGKIIEVLVEEGMNVKEGQVLARLDDSTLLAQIALAKSQVNAAEQGLNEIQVRVTEAHQNLERTLSLRERQLVSASVLNTAQAELAANKARLIKARSDVIVSKQNLALQKQYQTDYTIVAPFDGVVITKNAQPGEMISPAATGGSTRTGICTIVDMLSREIEVDVNESFINKVKPEQKVEAVLDAYPDWTIPARVINIVPTADRQKATVKVRIGFDELDDRILTDMGVKVTFLSGESEESVQTSVASIAKIRIPLEVIYTENSKDKVLLVDNDGNLSSVIIEVESRTLNNAIITSGLEGEETLVIDPAQYNNLSKVALR